MSSWGGGGSLVTMPSSPAPKTITEKQHYLSGTETSQFSGQQQTQDWESSYFEGTVIMPTMDQSDAQNWIAFLISCNGGVNVFQFPTGMVTDYPETLATALISGTALYFRLKPGTARWTIEPGSVYRRMTFDIRQAT